MGNMVYNPWTASRLGIPSERSLLVARTHGSLRDDLLRRIHSLNILFTHTHTPTHQYPIMMLFYGSIEHFDVWFLPSPL